MKPIISVIMPIYNVEPYLRDAIESVVNQTIDFKNIELILVNDGSNDGSEKICLDYQERFSDNVVYIVQKNSGVSAARNAGMEGARGKYINFFDADDIWQKDAFKKAVSFLEKYQHVDFVATKIKFFDGSIDEHPTNYKFAKTRVIDVNQDPNNPVSHLPTCVFRREALVGKRFDEGLSITEDAKLLSEVLLEKKRYGVLTGTHYNYRKRGNTSSAIGGGQHKLDFYVATPQLAYESMAKVWTRGGELHPYMQHLLLYDISYRIAGAPYKLLTHGQEKQYATTMLALLKRIDPQNIRQSRWYNQAQKDYLLSIRKKPQLDRFGFNDTKPEILKPPKHPILNIMFDWRFARAAEQFRRLRRYNLTQLSNKQKLFEYAKPWLIVAEAIADIPRALILRAGYYMAKQRNPREQWLVSDRPTAAGDNGEALFRYIQDQRPDVDVCFALSKKSADYNRLRNIGSIVNYGSWRYLLKFLLADKIISSHADVEVTNPFLRNLDHYGDLINHDFIFLQHGVIFNDLSAWLNKKDKNIRLFITSSKQEYDSIVHNPAYGYTGKEVKITGLARWDVLENSPKNKLVIAPTFRASLLKHPMRKDATRPYDPSFKDSEYFKFYDQLIHDKQINKALEQKGMTGEFFIHPNFAQQINDFKPSKHVKITQFPYDYKQALSEGSLLVTDYSSIVYDFAYQYKPVIYAQFDEAEFYKGQIYSKGYFYDYERDGFGPVCSDYDTSVKAVVACIEDGSSMVPKYKKRVDEYYAYHDKNNCQRIYKELISL